VRAVAAVGGQPVLLAATPGSRRRLDEVLDGAGGLLLPGGWDLDPALYGEEPSPLVGTTDPELDQAEMEALRAALDRGLPVLGICRGQQVINVTLGGTLHQHVPGHDGRGFARHRLAHPVEVESGSELYLAAGGPEVMVNSLHHQAVKDLGRGLRLTARSADGVVEGVELEDRIVAVQCHPEELVERSVWARGLLQGFVERAARRARQGQPQC
jgi:putative glutamine amidotransferase